MCFESEEKYIFTIRHAAMLCISQNLLHYFVLDVHIRSLVKVKIASLLHRLRAVKACITAACVLQHFQYFLYLNGSSVLLCNTSTLCWPYEYHAKSCLHVLYVIVSTVQAQLFNSSALLMVMTTFVMTAETQLTQAVLMKFNSTLISHCRSQGTFYMVDVLSCFLDGTDTTPLKK